MDPARETGPSCAAQCYFNIFSLKEYWFVTALKSGSSLSGWEAMKIAIDPFNIFQSHNVLVGIDVVSDKGHIPDHRFGDHIAFTV